MVVLQAFVDDSASDVGDRRMFLAGYIHGAEQWAAFSDAWQRQLWAPPKIDYFKMVEAQNLRGQFKGWSTAYRDGKVLALARIINQFEPWAVSCSVSRDEYNQILAPVAPYPLKNPYSACFHGIIRTTADYHRSLGIEEVPPVDFVFDEQGGLGDDAALWYRWEKESQEPDIQALLGSTPIFRDDKQMMPLQAADMLAWHLRRKHETGGLEDRKALKLIVGHGAWRHVDADALRTLAAGMRQVPGVEFVQTKAEWRGTRKAARAWVAAGLPPPDISHKTLRKLARKMRYNRLLVRLRRWARRFG